jgi:hypothetical protein
MRTRTAVIASSMLAAILLLLGLAASASADSPGLDQYVETLPNAGDKPDATDDSKNGGDNDNGDNGDSESTGSPTATGPAIDSSQLDALRSQGDAGRHAADALEATSGSDNSNGDSKADPKKAGHSKVEPLDPSEADGKAPVEAILSSMFGGSGIVLPIIMLAVLVGGLVIAARTRAGSID